MHLKLLTGITQKIAQVDYAKKMIANPVKVKVTNLGGNINSKGGDYAKKNFKKRLEEDVNFSESFDVKIDKP